MFEYNEHNYDHNHNNDDDMHAAEWAPRCIVDSGAFFFCTAICHRAVWREGGLSHDFDEYDVWPLMMVIFIAAERSDLRRMR